MGQQTNQEKKSFVPFPNTSDILGVFRSQILQWTLAVLQGSKLFYASISENS